MHPGDPTDHVEGQPPWRGPPPSRDVWQEVIDDLHETVIAADRSNTIIYANQATRSLLGWDPAELFGAPLTTIIPERLRGQHLAGFARFEDTGVETVVGRPIRLPALRKDGQEASVELVISTAEVAGEPIVVGLLRDASARIDLEGVGEVSQRLLSVLAEADELEEALASVLRSLCESLHWEVAQLWTVDDQQELRRRSAWATERARIHPEFIDASERSFAFGAGLPGRVWATQAPEWMSDVRGSQNFDRAKAARESGLCSAFAFPVIAGRSFLGVIELLSVEGRERSEEVTTRLAELGRQIGWFLERRTAEERRRELLQLLTFQTALLEAQTEAGLEGQVIVSDSGELISFNGRFAEIWGLDAQLLGRRADAEALAAAASQVADPEAFLRRVHEAYNARLAARDEIELLDGRVIDRVGVPLSSDGTDLGYAWYFRDVSDAKHLQRELADAGQRFAALAQTLQQSLLPPQLPVVEGVDLAARYHPAGDGSQVGGDFYDVFRAGRSWGLVVGDVCGKGAEAAVVTALVRYTIRAAAWQTRSPAKALAIVNEAMLRQVADGGLDRFATAVHARLRAQPGSVEVKIACGGHPRPLVRRADGTVEPVGHLGTLLGVMPDVSITDQTITLLPGDVLVVVTDGVIEARRDGEQFGDRALAELLGAVRGTAAEVAEAIEVAALAFQGGIAADDIAILALAVG